MTKYEQYCLEIFEKAANALPDSPEVKEAARILKKHEPEMMKACPEFRKMIEDGRRRQAK